MMTTSFPEVTMFFRRLRYTRRSLRRIGVSLFSVAVLGVALATTALPLSRSGCTPRMQERLFFGLSGPGGAISDADWEAFVVDVVTPRFPGGLTVLEAKGQWQGRDKQVTRESSRVVEIIHDDSKNASRRIAEIAAEYKARYRQESVLITRDRIDVCL
jgi:hypothetical protein